MEPVASGPADDAPGKEVNDDGKVEPALACPDIGDRFELLRLVQSRLGRSMFGHFGLQTEIGLGQPKIGLVQFEAQSEPLCEDFN